MDLGSKYDQDSVIFKDNKQQFDWNQSCDRSCTVMVDFKGGDRDSITLHRTRSKISFLLY